MRRRPDPADPATTQLLLDRLSAVLRESGPRRAAATEDVPPEVPALAHPGGEEPGRHRLESTGLDDPTDVPEIHPARSFSFGWLQIGVIVALVVVGLLCTGWAVLRARPVALATPLPVPPGTASPAASPAGRAGAGPSTPSAAAEIMVHVLGAVRRPGVVTLPDRARVQDALDAAGGLRDNADTADLNLAQVLQDGQQLVVGTTRKPSGTVRGGSGPGPAGNPSGTSSTGAGVVLDLNAATEAQLDQLPGVGPVTAGKITAWRTEHERFTRVEELQEVDGIGPKTYAQILPHVRV